MVKTEKRIYCSRKGVYDEGIKLLKKWKPTWSLAMIQRLYYHYKKMGLSYSDAAKTYWYFIHHT